MPRFSGAGVLLADLDHRREAYRARIEAEAHRR